MTDRTNLSSSSDDALLALDERASLLLSARRTEQKKNFNVSNLKESINYETHEVGQETDNTNYSEGEDLSNRSTENELKSDNDFDPIDSSPMYQVDKHVINEEEGNEYDQEIHEEIYTDEDSKNLIDQNGINDKLRNQGQNAYKKIRSLENQISLFKKKKEELDERIEELEVEKEMEHEEKLALEDERNNLERQKDVALEKLRLMSIDYINIENKLEEKNKKELELKSKVKISNERIQEFKEDHAILLEERNIFEEQNIDLLKNVQELNKKIVELVEQKTKLSSTLEHLQKDHERLETEHAKMKEDDTEKINSLSEEVGTLEEQLARIMGGDERLEEYERENERYELRLKQLGETNRNLEKQNRFLENQRSELQSRRDHLTIERERLLLQVEGLSTSLEIINKNMNSAQERHEAKNAEFSEQQLRHTEETKKAIHLNESLRQELEKTLEEKKMLENQIGMAEVETSNLLRKVEDLENLKSNINNNLGNLQSGIAEKDIQHSTNRRTDDENTAGKETRVDNNQLQSERDVLKTENAKLSRDLQKVNDRNQRLEIQLSEMVDMMGNRSNELYAYPSETLRSLNLGSDDKNLLAHLENEVVVLRTQCSSLQAELLSKNEQSLQLEQLRLQLDTTKRQLFERENVIVELKTRIELNELDIKSKQLMIEQLQQHNDQALNNSLLDAGDISHSTITSGSDSFIIQYEHMIEDLKAKLDDAYVENGKLLHQLTQVAQRAQDDFKAAKIQELQIQNTELQRILRLREEEIIREQNRTFDQQAKSQVRGEIVEGISELVNSSFNSTNKVVDISLSQDLSFLRSDDSHSNRRSTFTPHKKSVQPELQAIKVQLGDLHEQLESKNVDLEKAILTAQDLSTKLDDAQEKIQFMENCMQNTDKSISLLRDELFRKKQVINEMESRLKNVICSRCGGSMEIPTNAVSNRSKMIEKDIEVTLKKNLQTVEYIDELVKVVSRQNNFANLNQSNFSQSMQSIQQMIEGLYKQAANMQKIMEENAEVLKRLAESAFTESPKKPRRQTPNSSKLIRSPKMVDDTLEIKREDLKAIVVAGGNMMNTPSKLVSQIDSFATAVLEQEFNMSGIEDRVQLFSELFENYVKKFETFEILQNRIMQDLNNHRKISDTDSKNNGSINILITSVHELSADNIQLSAQIKKLLILMKSNILPENNFAKTLVHQETREEVEKLSKIIMVQDQIMEDYEEKLELLKHKEEEQIQKEMPNLSISKNSDISDQNDQCDLQLQIQELLNAWQLEVNANASLRAVIKEMKTRSESKETELNNKIENLIVQLNNISEQLQVFKIRAKNFESKFQQADESLKKKIENEEILRKEWNEMVEGHARDLEALRHRWNKERALLKESSTKTKTQQLAELEANHKELEDSWKQEKEILNKKLRTQKEASEREIKTLQKEIEKLGSTIRELKEELSSVMANKKTLTLEKALLTKEKSELQQQLDNLQKESTRYRSKNASVTELEGRIRRLQKEKDVTSEKASQKIKDLQSELQIEREKTSKLNKEKNSAIKEKSELQRKYMISNEMKESLETDIRDEKEHVKALEVEIQNITDQLQTERRDHQFKSEQLSRYEDELQAVQEQCNLLREKMEELQDTLSHERNQFKIQLQHVETANKRRTGPVDDEEVNMILDKNSRLQHDLIATNNKLQELKESAQNEINALQEEFQATKRQLELIEESQAVNSNSDDVKSRERIHEEYQRKFEEQDAKFKHKYQSELRNERKRYIEECDLLVKEVRYLRARCMRESGFRADLSYQKKFMMLLLGGVESCEQTTLLLISDIQNSNRRVSHMRPSPLLIKFRGAVTAILAIQRMRILKNSWLRCRELKRTIQQQRH
ncbi:10583_t:CDS:10 [Acaulospora morrowiae]|uniref:10583_t:CDS:1 n=1 Tax=Acaulospora morrowiae TaxID=94023 RepID=A0A9N8WAC2_9GLOM|nr:10583_t:CDS:10 [Acaulospora morrowiae]